MVNVIVRNPNLSLPSTVLCGIMVTAAIPVPPSHTTLIIYFSSRFVYNVDVGLVPYNLRVIGNT